MKTVTIEEFRAHLDAYLADAVLGEVLLTSAGKPWLVLRAIAADEKEDGTACAAPPGFWDMIHQRRQEHGIPWAEAKKELNLDQD